MYCFSYKMDHDYGLAPNPFWGVMSLAVCKGGIRSNKNLHIGDWIVGTGSMKLKKVGHLIYAMKVEDIITFDEYWNRAEYGLKKPVIKGTLKQMYGDNFYHTVNGNVVQEPSAHSCANMRPNETHLKRDTNGKNVLLSKHFYYFGCQCPRIPQEFDAICGKTRSYHYKDIREDLINGFVGWLEGKYETGILGGPINWQEFI